MKRITTEEFIERGNKIHNSKYDYSITNLEERDEKNRVRIICPIHGEFLQNVSHHLKGHGCDKCARELKAEKASLSTFEFIERSKEIHGNKYDYSSTNLNQRDEKGRV